VQTIADVVRERGPRANNFDLIRLVAAAVVLVSHSWPLTMGHERSEPLFALNGGQMAMGNLAVQVFFFVSGMMITASWLQNPSLASFTWKRALRLFPALIVAVMLTALVLGPALTTLPRADYAAHPGTWAYLANAALVTGYHLPGVFSGLPYADAVNGSLWTLPYEVRCYVMVAALGCVGALSGVVGGRIAVAIALAAALVVVALALVGADGPAIALKKQAELTVPFALGMLAWLWRDTVAVHGPRAVAVVLALVAGAAVLKVPFFPLVTAGAMLVLVPAIGYARAEWPRRLTASGDYSFGLYLYAFPVQQTLVALLPGIGVAGLVALALPITLLLAVLSWYLVERPALGFKGLALWGRDKSAPSILPSTTAGSMNQR
jgi:peptidoglycan/LPS O-acetylase OafA/YrhL